MKLFTSVCLVVAVVLVAVEAAKQKTRKTTVESEEEIVVKEGNVEKTYKVSKEEKDKNNLEWHVKRCPAGWYRFHNEKCFKFFPEQLSQSQAELACQAAGSTLASVSTDQERVFLKSLVLKESGDDEATLDKLWIGLRRKAGELYNFDLSPVAPTLAYVAGHSAQGTGNCASLACDATTVTNATGDFGKIAFGDCNELHTFACQKTIVDHYRTSTCSKDSFGH